MARMLYSASISLDGFMAGAGGDMLWLSDYLGPNPTVDALIGEIGSLLVGNRTFGGDDPNRGREGEGKPFGGGWDGPQIVLTHHAPAEPVPGVTFAGDLRTAIDAAKAAAGEKYVNILGADVARQCLEAGELDEVMVFLAPIMLGDGTRLFDHPGGTKIRLERIDLSAVRDATNLRYRVLDGRPR